MPEYLYIHIPFCIRKCIYCDFYSVPYDDSMANTYIDALCRELYLKKDLAGRLRSVYIGGGTPPLLPDECIRKLFEALKEHFTIARDCEITVEANPGTLSESKTDLLLSSGVNRISLGVQSLNDPELLTLGRIHTAGDAVNSVHMIKQAGISNLSIDLMYGIPGQTLSSWARSLSQAIDLEPTHISSYELTPEENTPLHKLIVSHKITMPDEEIILDMYGHAIEYLTGSGYEHYEISNFARAGYRCLHNLNYWDRGEYIGAGAGAHSFVNNVRSQNIKNREKYSAYLNNNRIPETETTEPTAAESLKELIFLGLRKREGINLHNLSPLCHFLAGEQNAGYTCLINASEGLRKEGYLEISNNFLRFTQKGLVLANTVIVNIFENLGL
jgi:oxygen-independent coproporphyrinogen-3 oxidase